MVRLDGTSVMARELLGNKAFGINSMRAMDLPVPPAFCLTTEVCARYFEYPDGCMDSVWPDVLVQLRWLEEQTGRTFGAGPLPLLVSVRSGAAQSMPGMLDTVLNLGFTDEVEKALAVLSASEFAADTRRRFLDMYLRTVAGDEKAAVPADAYQQLRSAVEAVFRSWTSDRAVAYRRHQGLSDSGGTAVIIQAMVFGNLGADSGTGVLFTRNPTTGAAEALGEWLSGGQGEDVVSGAHDVSPVSELRQQQPLVFAELEAMAAKLEEYAGDVQDIEYTVESGRLWLLQTRNAKRSAQAAVRFALQFHHEGHIDEVEVARRVTPEHIRALLLPSLQPEARMAAPLLASGLAAAPGVAAGRAYSDIDEAIDAADEGEAVILVRSTTSPDDVEGMIAATGIVTEIGGATSHAAVVSREIGRPTVVGCGVGTAATLEGRLITVDGDNGEIRDGLLPLTAWSEADHPDLRELDALVRRVSPLLAHVDGDHRALDEVSPEAVTAAIELGHRDVVSPSPLQAMLVAVRATAAGH